MGSHFEHKLMNEWRAGIKACFSQHKLEIIDICICEETTHPLFITASSFLFFLHKMLVKS